MRWSLALSIINPISAHGTQHIKGQSLDGCHAHGFCNEPDCFSGCMGTAILQSISVEMWAATCSRLIRGPTSGILCRAYVHPIDAVSICRVWHLQRLLEYVEQCNSF